MTNRRGKFWLETSTNDGESWDYRFGGDDAAALEGEMDAFVPTAARRAIMEAEKRVLEAQLAEIDRELKVTMGRVVPAVEETSVQ